MSSLLSFNRFYRLEIQSVMLVISTGFMNYCPCNLLSDQLSPPSLCEQVYYIHVYTVVRGGGSMGSQEGRGPRTDKTPAAKFLYKSIFQITTFGIVFYQSNLSTILCQVFLVYSKIILKRRPYVLFLRFGFFMVWLVVLQRW